MFLVNAQNLKYLLSKIFRLFKRAIKILGGHVENILEILIYIRINGNIIFIDLASHILICQVAIYITLLNRRIIKNQLSVLRIMNQMIIMWVFGQLNDSGPGFDKQLDYVKVCDIKD